MSDLQFLKRVEELNRAILNMDYAQIKKLLNDPETAINIGLELASLPLRTMFDRRCPQIARLFLECPRVDWLAMEWDRNLLNLERDFGVQYEPARNYLVSDSVFDYFYYLDDEFIEDCPEEAEQIYERIIEALLAANVPERKDLLLFKTLKSFYAFKVAFKYFPNVNAVDKNGATLLHNAEDPKIVLFLLQNGAKLNEYSKLNMSLFLQDIETAKTLHEADANLFLQVVKDSPSLLKFHSSTPYHEKSLLLANNFPMTEEFFRAELQKDGYTLHNSYFKALFEKYPSFKVIFEADLPNNLPINYHWYSCKELHAKLSDEELLHCFRKSFERGDPNSHAVYMDRNVFIKTYANEFLHRAIQANNKDMAESLVKHCGASWTSLHEGKSLLFVAEPWMIGKLVENGVSPFFEHDGYRFFEQNSKISNRLHLSHDWMEQLLAIGFDIFSRNTKSGKSLVDCLNPNAICYLSVDYKTIRFPVRKLSKHFFDAITPELKGPFTPLDEEGNTMLHYVDLKIDRLGAYDFKKAVNKAGRSAVERAVEEDKGFDFGIKLYGENLDAFIAAYNALHGTGWIDRIGGKLMVKCIAEDNSELLKYLLDSGKVSFNRFIGPSKTVLQNIESGRFYSYRSSFEVAIKKGLPVSIRMFERFTELVRDYYPGALSAFLNRCDDLMPYIECYFKSTDLELNFLQHKKVKKAILKSAENGISILDRYFFKLAKNKSFVELLQNYGADARKLIGMEVKLEPADASKIEKSGWLALADSGWTLDDFKNLSVFDQFKRESSSFSLAFTAKRTIKDIQIDLVYNSELICPICKDEIGEDDSITLLSCRHLYHRNCVEDYLEEYRRCPFCQATVKLEKLC